MNDISLFSLWTPLTLSKAADLGETLKAYIGGIVSTEAQDLQGDKILQGGCQWDYFLSKGWLNYEHQQGAENILGVPTAVSPVTLDNGNSATRIEGYLMLDRPKAREVYEAAKAIQTASTGLRSIGFSVEGQVLARDPDDPQIITKSRILNVSVTAHPVNPDARLEILARSLSNSLCGQDDDPEGTIDMEEPDTKKGMVGVQQPAQADPSASLSPLVPSSHSEKVAVATSPDGKQEDISTMVERMMRQVMKEEMSTMMSGEVGKMMDAVKNYSNDSSLPPSNKSVASRSPMISLPQMQTLLTRVFPQLPAAENRAMARKLLSAAKNYHNA